MKKLKDERLYFSKFVLSSTCAEPNYQLILLTDVAVDLCCCAETIKNTSMSQTAALGDEFLHYEEFGQVSLFRNGCKDSDHVFSAAH